MSNSSGPCTEWLSFFPIGWLFFSRIFPLRAACGPQVSQRAEEISKIIWAIPRASPRPLIIGGHRHWILCPRCPASDIGRSYSDISPVTVSIFESVRISGKLKIGEVWYPISKSFLSNIFLFMSGPVSLSLSVHVYDNVYLQVHVAWKWTWTGTGSGHGHSHRREYGYSCLAQGPLFIIRMLDIRSP
jgi:hypothetical protein